MKYLKTYDEFTNKNKYFFRIVELKIENDYLQGFKSIFSNNNHTDKPYASVLIGPNGTRKSIILKMIIDIFREIDYAKYNNTYKKYTNGKFHLTYILNDTTYELFNYKEPVLKEDGNIDFELTVPGSTPVIKAKINGEIVSDLNNIEVPTKVIASTIMLTDRFPVIRKVEGQQLDFKSYKYLGIRNDNSPLSAGTRQYIRKTVDFIVSSITKQNFRGRLGKVLSFLDFEKELSISYIPKYKPIFYNKNLTPNKFKSLFENWQETFPKRKNEPWGKWYFDKIKNNSLIIEQIVGFLNNVELKKYGRGGRYFDFEIFEDNTIVVVFQILQHLSKLDLISYPELTLRKKDNYFDISNSSSGELQIISSFIGLMANIEPNSLILIDEPEISLHPNWQKRYIEILNNIFSKNYSSCHFIIASHSHFIISDLKGENSSIIGLNVNEKNANKLDTTFFDINTYGWSAEQILLDIFKMSSTRNYYLTKIITRVLKELSEENPNYSLIKKQLDKVIFLNLSDFSKDDPLRDIFNELKKLYKTL